MNDRALAARWNLSIFRHLLYVDVVRLQPDMRRVRDEAMQCEYRIVDVTMPHYCLVANMLLSSPLPSSQQQHLYRLHGYYPVKAIVTPCSIHGPESSSTHDRTQSRPSWRQLQARYIIHDTTYPFVGSPLTLLVPSTDNHPASE